MIFVLSESSWVALDKTVELLFAIFVELSMLSADIDATDKNNINVKITNINFLFSFPPPLFDKGD